MKDKTQNKDAWGITLSLLCAVHCAILPLLLPLGLSKTFAIMAHPAIEISVIAMTSYFVFTCILRPYMNQKLPVQPVILAVVGLTLVILHFFLPVYATLAVVIGGLSIAMAHVVKLKWHFTTH